MIRAKTRDFLDVLKPIAHVKQHEDFIARLQRGLDRNLPKAGGFIRQKARRLIRSTSNPSLFSKPGEPPRSHTGKYKNSILFAIANGSLLVGPTRFCSNTAKLLEHGGIAKTSAAYSPKDYEIGDWGYVSVIGKNRQRFSAGWTVGGASREHTAAFLTSHPKQHPGSGYLEQQRVLARDKKGALTKTWVVRRELTSGAMIRRASELWRDVIMSGHVGKAHEYRLAPRPVMRRALEESKTEIVQAVVKGAL